VIISMGVLTYKGATAQEAIASEVKAAIPTWEKKQGFGGNKEAIAGATLFAESGCTNCHTYLGTGSSNLGAPDLSAEGAKGKGVQFQIDHLKCPSCVNPGSPMPPFAALGEDNLHKLARLPRGLQGDRSSAVFLLLLLVALLVGVGGFSAGGALSPTESGVVAAAQQQGMTGDALSGARVLRRVGLHELPHLREDRVREPRRARPDGRGHEGQERAAAGPPTSAALAASRPTRRCRRFVRSAHRSAQPRALPRRLEGAGRNGARFPRDHRRIGRAVRGPAAGGARCRRVRDRSLRLAGGIEVLATELYGDARLSPDETLARLTERVRDAVTLHDERDWHAPYASGSARVDGYVICPCSMGTLGTIASGAMSNLIQRAASVALKEERKLVICPRETPLSTIHLENMLRVRQAGATVLFLAPGFYHGARSVDDLVDFVVARCLDQLGLEHELVRRWGQD
jgi:4-hydroxy-3-polyprenylbenzoate decarboxylase